MIASNTERFLLEKVAPEVISRKGKTSILFIYALLTGMCLYSGSHMEVYFDHSLLIAEPWPDYNYWKIQPLLDIG